MPLEQLGGSVMRFRANDRVGAHRVAYVFDAALAHLFGFAERPAHIDDCSVMLFDPRFPGRDPLLHLCVLRLLGKGVPGCHTRAGFAPEEDGEKRIARAHNVSICLTVILGSLMNSRRLIRSPRRRGASTVCGIARPSARPSALGIAASAFTRYRSLRPYCRGR